MLDSSKLNQYYFEEICKIPHPSNHEKALSDYIVSQAVQHGYSYYQDALYNVLVNVPATEGYENSDVVMLSGHMDMVSSTALGKKFDFTTQPIELVLDGHILLANGTTLGADDGVAVAYMLALMADTCAHPALELLFTTQEETGTYGAAFFDVSRLKAKHLIGLDTEGEHVVTIGNYCSDLIKIKLEYPMIKKTQKAFKIHFGDIEGYWANKNKARIEDNAGQYFASIMFNKKFELGLITGGVAENMPFQFVDAIVAIDEAELKDIPLLSYEEVEYDQFFSVEDSHQIMQDILDVPNGTLKYEDQVVQCHNFGAITQEGNQIVLIGSTRCKTIELNTEVKNDLFSRFNKVETSFRYQGWPHTDHHELKDIYAQVSREIFGKEIEEAICGGGLEIAIFLNKMSDLDVLSIGPIDGDFHTSKEWLDLDSFDRVYDAIKLTLARMK